MSRKRKYSNVFREMMVQKYLSGKYGGFKALSTKYGMAPIQLKRWVHLYKAHGLDGLISTGGKYSGEFKLHVIEYMNKNHLSLREVATHFCIPSDSTVGKWEHIYYEKGSEALMEDRRGRKGMRKTHSKPKENANENEDLLAEVERLRMENEYLKKLNALVLEREESEQKKK